MENNQPEKAGGKGDINQLVDAFRYFNETATSLNASFRRLEKRVEQLTLELEEKDRQLYSRLQELDRVSKFLASLLESTSSGVIAIDLDGRITIMNNTFSRLTGLNASDSIGKLYEEVIGAENLDCGALYTLKNGPEIRSVERILPERNIFVEVSTTWVIDSNDDRIGVVELVEDVSTIRQLEERFERQKTMSALGEMASAVAHELRNPLAGIGGFAALLKEDIEGEPEKMKLLDKIINGVNDLERLTSKMLFLTKPVQVKMDTFDLKQLVIEVMDILKAEAYSKDIPAVFKSQFPQENTEIIADKDLTRMILTNLGKNALQSLRGEGCIRFNLTWQFFINRVNVTVEDDGCGIAEDNLSRLFNPFFTTRADGTGLGLALVKKAVDLQKGSLNVKSEIDAGSQFQVLLPIRPMNLTT